MKNNIYDQINDRNCTKSKTTRSTLKLKSSTKKMGDNR